MKAHHARTHVQSHLVQSTPKSFSGLSHGPLLAPLILVLAILRAHRKTLGQLEAGCRMIYAGVPSFFRSGLEDGHVPTFWDLLWAYTQIFQKALMKEYALNHNKDPCMI